MKTCVEHQLWRFLKSNTSGGYDTLILTTEYPQGRNHPPVCRLYWNRELTAVGDIDSMGKIRRDVYNITDRDMGVLPANPDEWTGQERRSIILALTE